MNTFLFLARLIDVIEVLILLRIVLSWIDPQFIYTYKQPQKLLRDITEPIMAPFRNIIPPIGMMDISPMILFLALGFLRTVFYNLAA